MEIGRLLEVLHIVLKWHNIQNAKKNSNWSILIFVSIFINLLFSLLHIVYCDDNKVMQSHENHAILLTTQIGTFHLKVVIRLESYE